MGIKLNRKQFRLTPLILGSTAIYTLFRAEKMGIFSGLGVINSNWWPQSNPKQFDLQLTLADLCMTFDPSNVLCTDQEFLLPNLLALWYF